MRVTESVRMLTMSRALRDGATRMLDLSGQIASGQKVDKPSDNPNAYASIVRRSGLISRLESRRDALDRTSNDLRLAESALASAGDLLMRVRELAVQYADASFGQPERDAAAKEVAVLRQQLATTANAKGQRGYLFAGSKTQTPPIDPSGAFVGDTVPLQVEYADGQYTPANVDGAYAFSAAGGNDPFALLAKLEADLSSGDTVAIRSSLDKIEATQAQIAFVRTGAGVAIQRLESAAGFTSTSLGHAAKLQADEKQGDLTELATRFSEAQAAYERSIAVTRQVLNVASLVDRM